jgi:hypothetical protein
MRLKVTPLGVVRPAHGDEPFFLEGGPGMTGRGVPQPSAGSLKPRFPGSPPQPAASTSKSSARVLSKGWGEPRRVTLRSLRRKHDGSRGSPPHSHRARFSPACTEKCRCLVEPRYAPGGSSRGEHAPG